MGPLVGLRGLVWTQKVFSVGWFGLLVAQIGSRVRACRDALAPGCLRGRAAQGRCCDRDSRGILQSAAHAMAGPQQVSGTLAPSEWGAFHMINGQDIHQKKLKAARQARSV